MQSLFLLVVILAGVFFLVHLTPGGPEAALLANPRIGPDEVQRLRERFGLDQPLVLQYLRWVSNGLRLDFGRSYFYSRPATEVILERLGPTVQLGLLSYVVALLGVPLGMLAALNAGKPQDTIVRLFSTLGTAVPTWWLGLTIIVGLNSVTGWFPNGQGRGSPGEWLKYIIVPATVLGLSGLVSFARFVRSGVLDTLREDYVRTARAKGLNARAVVLRHVLRNALLPVVTLLGGLLPVVLSGAIVTEYVFSIGGVGEYAYDSIGSLDVPPVMALTLFIAFFVVFFNTIVDIVYAWLDPRIRIG